MAALPVRVRRPFPFQAVREFQAVKEFKGFKAVKDFKELKAALDDRSFR